MAIVKITEENFAKIDPAMLRDSSRYPQVEAMVASVDAAYTPSYSKQYAILLRDKLEPVIDNLPPDLQTKYFRLIKVLLLQSLDQMSDPEKERFFRESILEVFYADISDPRLWVDLIFRKNYALPEKVESYRRLFLKGLNENIQVLGNQEIKVAGEDAPKPPILANWLLDYVRVSRASTSKSRGRIEEGRFMNASQNVQRLSLPDKNALLKVLEFYDWLNFADLKYDFSFPGEKAREKIYEEGEYSTNIPRELVDKINRMRAEKAVAKAPARPQAPAPVAPKFTDMSFSKPPVIPRPPVPARPVFTAQPKFTQAPAKPVDGAAKFSMGSILNKISQPAEPRREAPRKNELRPTPPKSYSFSASALSKVSLSSAIANADQESLPQSGNLRMGKIQPQAPAKPSMPADLKEPVPNLQADFKPKPAFIPVPQKPQFAANVPQAPAMPKPAMQNVQAVAPAARAEAAAAPANALNNLLLQRGAVVDLSRKPLLNIAEINKPELFQQITAGAFPPEGFDEKLSQLKQKIVDISKDYQLPIKKVTDNFYRSPLYVLYVSMAVAVMNDTSASGQSEAFEKVAKNYQAAKKESLTYRQFVSLGNFKKELAGLEESI